MKRKPILDQNKARLRKTNKKQKDVESYLGLGQGEFDHIPHYARDAALNAICNVLKMERESVFRPGVYYITLIDLCRSTESSAKLGAELQKKRIESFILTAIEALGTLEPRNYFLPIREIGDAVLILFASFADMHEWWRSTQDQIDARNVMWKRNLSPEEFKIFEIQAKTIVHAGEVSYSDGKIPIALSVNQVFKVEKAFNALELGITEIVSQAAQPIITELRLRRRRRGEAKLPGTKEMMPIYLIDKWKN